MSKIYKNPDDLMTKLVEEKKRWNPLPTEGYQFDEKYEDFNDYYGEGEPITASERGFNVSVGNDFPVYDYFTKNLSSLRDRYAKGEDYRNLINELHSKAQWKDNFNPKNIRKEYFERLLNDPEWNNK